MSLPDFDKWVFYDAPSNGLAFGRTQGTTPNGTGKQWAYLGYKINYTGLAGEDNMEAGEPSALCGEYDKFVAGP